MTVQELMQLQKKQGTVRPKAVRPKAVRSKAVRPKEDEPYLELYTDLPDCTDPADPDETGGKGSEKDKEDSDGRRAGYDHI